MVCHRSWLVRHSALALDHRSQAGRQLLRLLLQVLHKGVDQCGRGAVQRADQAHGKRHLDAEGPHMNAIIGVIQRGQRG
ncbi:Uncharacterised protein [Serratia fonticola]|uniref:Uncharacterized protein n=1 Tax=Serratia fonticola TaxID=47917 RepID=A0A4U9V6A5_SERFO|nr:Uncharacterised protein [Serratia fonticola]